MKNRITQEQFNHEMNRFFEQFDPPTLRSKPENDLEYRQAADRLDIARCQELAMLLIKGEARSLKQAAKLKDYY